MGFRFGLWMGLVTGVVIAVLWDKEQQWDVDAAIEEVSEPISLPPEEPKNVEQ